MYNGVGLPKANLVKHIAGAGGGVVSLWQETGDKLQLLQSQSISEQPVNCLDWNRDKPGESVSLNIKENIEHYFLYMTFSKFEPC